MSSGSSATPAPLTVENLALHDTLIPPYIHREGLVWTDLTRALLKRFSDARSDPATEHSGERKQSEAAERQQERLAQIGAFLARYTKNRAWFTNKFLEKLSRRSWPDLKKSHVVQSESRRGSTTNSEHATKGTASYPQDVRPAAKSDQTDLEPLRNIQYEL